MAEPNVPSPVFVSYAHKDNDDSNPTRRWLDRLRTHLRPLEFEGQLTICSDQDIGIGDDWHEHIQTQLNGARVIVLLISSNFMASEYIQNSELPVLLRNAKERGSKILPVLVGPSMFRTKKFKYPDPKIGPEEFSLASLQAGGSPEKTLLEMNDGEQERTLLVVAERIKEIVEDLAKRMRLNGKPENAEPAAALARRFKLRKVILVEIPREADIRAGLGKAAAEYFLENVPERSRVALSCADTVFEVAKALPAFARKLYLYPISYNVDPEMLSVRSPYSTLLQICSKNPQAIAYNITLPAFFLSEEERSLVRGRRDIVDLLAEAHDPNAAFYSVGHFGAGSSYDVATTYIRRYIRATFHQQELVDLGATGEINLFPFAFDGTPIDHPLANLCACLDLRRIRDLSREHERDMVLVAGGRQKTRAVLAALRGGFLNVLVTDAQTAREILMIS